MKTRARGKKRGEIPAVREMRALMPANETNSAELSSPLRSQGLNSRRGAGVESERVEIREGLTEAEGDEREVRGWRVTPRVEQREV